MIKDRGLSFFYLGIRCIKHVLTASCHKNMIKAEFCEVKWTFFFESRIQPGIASQGENP